MHTHSRFQPFNLFYRFRHFLHAWPWMIVIVFILFLGSCAKATPSGPECNSFIENSDGTVTDSITGLVWKKKASFFGENWHEASDYCQELSLGGNSTWRLPEVKILEDLYSKKKEFPGGINGRYWSSSQYGWKMGVFNFETGKLYANLKSKGMFNVLCVRSNSEAWDNSSLPLSLLLDWQTAGFSPDEALEWMNIANNNRPGILFLFKPADAISWQSAGFSAVEAKEWMRAGLKPESAKNWRDVSFNPTDAKRWQASGFKPQEALEWDSLGESPDDAKNWKLAGFQPTEATDWEKVGLDSMSAKAWFQKNFTPNDAKAWIDAKFSISEAAKWQEFHFPPTDGQKWRDSGFNPSNAAEWRDDGLPLNEAKSWIGFNPAEARKLKGSCPKGIYGWMEMLKASPYDTAGRCYHVTGSNIQFLGKSKALFMLFREPFYIDFGKDLAPKGVWEGFVKGEGAYEYIDLSGATRVVPKVKVLKLDLQ